MKSLFTALAAVLVAAAFTLPATVASAQVPSMSDNKGQRDNPSAFRANKVAGKLVTLSDDASFGIEATYDSVDFGFVADYVEVCIEDASTRPYMLWTAAGALPSYATTPSRFVNGGDIPGEATPSGAVPLHPGGGGADGVCYSGPWATDGIVFYAGSDATLDVRAYAE